MTEDIQWCALKGGKAHALRPDAPDLTYCGRDSGPLVLDRRNPSNRCVKCDQAIADATTQGTDPGPGGCGVRKVGGRVCPGKAVGTLHADGKRVVDACEDHAKEWGPSRTQYSGLKFERWS